MKTVKLRLENALKHVRRQRFCRYPTVSIIIYVFSIYNIIYIYSLFTCIWLIFYMNDKPTWVDNTLYFVCVWKLYVFRCIRFLFNFDDVIYTARGRKCVKCSFLGVVDRHAPSPLTVPHSHCSLVFKNILYYPAVFFLVFPLPFTPTLNSVFSSSSLFQQSLYIYIYTRSFLQ